MEIQQGDGSSSSNYAISLYFLFKMLPILVSGLAIFLGYKLFVLGVTGEASIIVDAKNVDGQLINAAPGLFFAVGGIVALIFIVIKGVKIKAGGREMLMRRSGKDVRVRIKKK